MKLPPDDSRAVIFFDLKVLLKDERFFFDLKVLLKDAESVTSQ